MILFWVGSEYHSSIGIFQILMISMFFGVIIRPASYYFIARLKHKLMYAQALVSIGVFYASIFFLKDDFGIESLAIAKVIVAIALGLIAIKGIFKIISFYNILKKVLIPSIVIGTAFYIYLPNIINNITSLIEFLLFLSVSIIFSYVLIIISNNSRRQDIKMMLNACVKYCKK